MIKLIKKNHRN